MSLYNTKKVKELPQLEEIIDGNYLIVENEIGTNIIDFADFVVGPNNVSFYNVVVSLCSRSISMSASVDSGLQNLSSTFIGEVNNRVDSLTANYPGFFEVYPNTLVVNANALYGKSDFNSELGDISVNDINVSPTNNAAARMSWTVFLSSVQNPGTPPNPTPYTYSIIISSGSGTQGTDSTFETKVTKYF